MSEYRRLDTEAWERKKQYLIRSLFYDIGDLSTIREEGDTDESPTTSPPFCPSPEPYRLHSPRPPSAPREGHWSPLPPLIIEIEPNKHDEPEENYKRLEKKILKIYKRIFFEDRSDISDINTTDDDDFEDIPRNEPNDYSRNSIEIIELKSKSEIDKSIENPQSNQEMEPQRQSSIDSPPLEANVHENSRNSAIDKNYENQDDDNQRNSRLESNVESDSPNLESNVESDEESLPVLEANIESDKEHVSSSTDVAKSSESDGNRDSETPISSTVVISRSLTDEVRLEENEVLDTIHHIERNDAKADDSRSSKTRVQATHEEDVNMENQGSPNEDMKGNASMDTDNNCLQILNEIEEMRTPRAHLSTGSIKQTTPQIHIEPNIIIVEHRASMEAIKYSSSEEDILRNNNVDQSAVLDLFDLIRLSSPGQINIEDSTRRKSREENIKRNSRENPEINARGENILRSSHENNEERKSIEQNNERIRILLEDNIERNSREENIERCSPENNEERKSIEQNTERIRISHEDNIERNSREENIERSSNENNEERKSIEQNTERIRISLEDNIERNSREENIERSSHENNGETQSMEQNIEDNIERNSREENIEKNYPEDNTRKRKTVPPSPNRLKRNRLEDKGVQTDYLEGTKSIQYINVNIY